MAELSKLNKKRQQEKTSPGRNQYPRIG